MERRAKNRIVSACAGLRWSRSSDRSGKTRRRAFLASVEVLEEIMLLSTYTVTSTADITIYDQTNAEYYSNESGGGILTLQFGTKNHATSPILIERALEPYAPAQARRPATAGFTIVTSMTHVSLGRPTLISASQTRKSDVVGFNPSDLNSPHARSCDIC